MNEIPKQNTNEAILREIESAQPKIEWAKNNSNLFISLPHDCSIDASVYQDDDGKSLMEINEFRVSPSVWSDGKNTGHDVGTRLMRTLAEVAKKMGISIVTGIIYDKAALVVRAKVFGKDNLKFFHAVSGDPVNKSFDQVLEEKFEPEFSQPGPQDMRYKVVSEVTKFESNDKKI